MPLRPEEVFPMLSSSFFFSSSVRSVVRPSVSDAGALASIARFAASASRRTFVVAESISVREPASTSWLSTAASADADSIFSCSLSLSAINSLRSNFFRGYRKQIRFISVKSQQNLRTDCVSSVRRSVHSLCFRQYALYQYISPCGAAGAAGAGSLIVETAASVVRKLLATEVAF